ncbi:hypothetical protein C8034_v008805 [Colletotrichum sidae]|uniref:Uncharacterized protein n=1 Tax=Colletotrichum sidae TaxID=1347389 RepID=A0A4R8T2U2_9PEZI|nr:hypothetical protein C8034_v008805 [Colletotrichum sidae]
MHLKSLPVVAALAALYMALGVQAAAECTVGEHKTANCCWGDRNGGSAACKRQRGGRLPKDEVNACETETANWCSTVNISKDKCAADCCDVKTGWGIPCPG